jgi:shikimate 5-dehydrogenase
MAGPKICIIGAGPSSIAAGTSLPEAGLSDIAIFDNVAQKIDGLIGPAREDFACYGHRGGLSKQQNENFSPGAIDVDLPCP